MQTDKCQGPRDPLTRATCARCGAIAQSQACEFHNHASCPRENTLGTHVCLCQCHKKETEEKEV